MSCDQEVFWGRCPRCSRELWLLREQDKIHCAYCDYAATQRQMRALYLLGAIAIITFVLWLILATEVVADG